MEHVLVEQLLDLAYRHDVVPIRLGVADELHALAEREAPRLGLDPEEAFHYLHSDLHYRLGERERQALETFFRLAAEEGLAPAGVPLRPVQQAAMEAHG